MGEEKMSTAHGRGGALFREMMRFSDIALWLRPYSHYLMASLLCLAGVLSNTSIFNLALILEEVMAFQGPSNACMGSGPVGEAETRHSSLDVLDVLSNAAFSGTSSYVNSVAVPTTKAEDTQTEDEEEAWDSSEEEPETKEEFATKQANFFRQMMFVSGETAEPSVETTTLIEDIVRQQVVEIVSYFSALINDTY
jgi:hypothetical protein